MNKHKNPSVAPSVNEVFDALVHLRTRLSLSPYPKTTNRTRQASYALEKEDMPPRLRAEIDALWNAMANLDPTIDCFEKMKSLATPMTMISWVYRLLGVAQKIFKIPLERLSLEDLVSFAPNKTALRQARSYEERVRIEQDLNDAAEKTQKNLKIVLKYLRKERLIHPATEINVVLAYTVVGKLLYYLETEPLKAPNFGDIPALVVLRQELKEAKERAKNAPPAADESLKWLDWPEFIACVHHLEQECQPVYAYGLERSQTAIAQSVQRYLLFAFLAYMPPDRQRTLRELEVGRTLVKGVLRPNGTLELRDDGQWYIHLKGGDYKTGDTYGEQNLMVPDILYPYLEAWLNQWRAILAPNHNFVFTKKNGKPYKKASDLSSIIKRATYRLAGKLTTSHLIRHMLITYLKRNGASDEIMESLANAMRHSTKVQSGIYDRRSRTEKATLAQDLVLKLASGEPVSNVIGTQRLTVEDLAQRINQLTDADRQRLLAMLHRS